MCSERGNAALPALGFPIRASADHRPFSASSRLIAAVHALLRLLVPRHPPCALDILTVINTSWFEPGTPKHRHKAGGGCIPGSVIPVYCIGLHVQFSRSAEKARRPGDSRPVGLSKLNSMQAPSPPAHPPRWIPYRRRVCALPVSVDVQEAARARRRGMRRRHEQPLQSWSYP